MGCRGSKQQVHASGAATSSIPGDRKLVCLVLHGTTMDGEEMKGMYKSKECGIDPFCQDIAEFYYATGPCVVSKNHEIWKAIGVERRDKRGDKARHWYTMGDKWDFGPKNFAKARTSLAKFVESEIGKPVDVIIGYSQGAAATTQILNDLYDTKMKNPYGTKHFLDKASVRAAIFHGCPKHPKPNNESIGQNVFALHCNGDKDPLTGLKEAKEHASNFGANGTFFEFEGGHEVQKVQQEPVRKFLLNVKGGETE